MKNGRICMDLHLVGAVAAVAADELGKKGHKVSEEALTKAITAAIEKVNALPKGEEVEALLKSGKFKVVLDKHAHL